MQIERICGFLFDPGEARRSWEIVSLGSFSEGLEDKHKTKKLARARARWNEANLTHFEPKGVKVLNKSTEAESTIS